MRIRLRLASLTAVPLLTACGDTSADPAAEIAFDTLPNGAVHVSNPETGLWREGEGWQLVEDLRIGAMDGDGPDVFGQVRGIEVDERGRIYVLDHQAHAVQVFARDGRHLRTLGRAGEGPGEFRSAFGLRFDAEGRLWVADHATGRYTLFGPEGELVDTRSRPFRSWGFLWEGFFADDRLVETEHVRDDDGESRQVFVRYGPELEPLDTLPRPAFQHEVYGLRDPSMPPGFYRMAAWVPFTPRLQWSPRSDGHLWTGVGDRYRVHLQTLTGDTVRIVERAYAPVHVTTAERDEALAAGFLQRMRDEGADIDPRRIPEHKPAFESLFEDDRGYLWVRTPSPEGDEGTRLDVFDPEGRYLGQLRTAVPLQPMPSPVVRGDALYALVTDDLDVPYVARFRIEGRPGAR